MKNDDGTVFGPISFDQLRQWSQDAQVSPLDKISTDERNWIKAPMVPELHMDYLVEVSPDQFYGPTTLSAVREFLQMGEINAETTVTNCRDGSSSLVKDIPELQSSPEDEEALMEERRAREQAEHLVVKLETKLGEITRAASM